MPKELPPEIRIKRGDYTLNKGRLQAKDNCQIDILLRKGYIDEAEWQAANDLAQTYHRTGIEGGSSWIGDKLSSGGSNTTGVEITDRQIDARRKFYKVMDKLSPDMQALLWQVVMFDYQLNSLGLPKGMPSKVIKMALGQLARVYGYK